MVVDDNLDALDTMLDALASCGFDAFLVKPVDVASLAEVVRQWLEGPATGPA